MILSTLLAIQVCHDVFESLQNFKACKICYKRVQQMNALSSDDKRVFVKHQMSPEDKDKKKVCLPQTGTKNK